MFALSRPEISVSVGILGAALLILIARRFPRRREILIYGVGLGFTALAYVLLGLQLGAPPDHLRHELLGGVPYLALAVLGTWRWPALLALGWIAHTLWDLAFHFTNGPGFAPAWYAFFCVGFDLIMGGYIAGRLAVLAQHGKPEASR